MAVRGFLRDILSLYLGFKLLGMWIFNAPFSSGIGWAAVLLILITVWFVMEKVGIV